MTEIPIFPAGGPPPDIAEPAPGDWAGLFHGIHLHLGKIARNLPDPRRVRLEDAQNVDVYRLDPIPIQLAGGNGVLDDNRFGPPLGRRFDVHTISATGFTAGSVSGWINLPSLATGVPQGALRAPFTQAGVLNWGKAQLALRYGEGITFIATNIVGSVIISMDATVVAEEYWGRYVL